MDIKNAIPNSVRHLIFRYRFNQEIKGSLPNSITHLMFGFCFNKNINRELPNFLTHLIFSYDFNQNISANDGIPHTVKYLKILYLYKDTLYLHNNICVTYYAS